MRPGSTVARDPMYFRIHPVKMEVHMNGFLSLPTWSPYIVGVGIGLLVCLALVVSDRPIGCSTAFVKATGLIEQTHSREEGAGERILQEISPTHRLAIHHCARALSSVHSSPPSFQAHSVSSSFRHSGLHSSETQLYSGSSQPSPGESSSGLGHGGPGAARAGMGSVEHCNCRSGAFSRPPVSLREG